MKSEIPIWRKNYFLFVASMLVLIAVFLVWVVRDRIDEFQEYHHYIAFESLTGVSNEVSRFIREQNHRVRLFARYQLDSIRAVAENPSNEQAYQILKQQIEEFFPDHFAFTVASPEGIPMFEDFNGLVAESCEVDIKNFAAEHVYYPYVHPNSEGYHFDVMAQFGVKNDSGDQNGKLSDEFSSQAPGINATGAWRDEYEGVLFVSFHVDILGSILRSAQSLGHQLMLIYPSRDNLIEVVSDGARNKLKRNDFRLSPEEEGRVLVQMPVSETRWDAVDIHDPGLFDDYQARLFVEALIIFCAFLLIGMTLVVRLRKAEKRGRQIEQQKKELVRVITHELRSPAAATHGALQLLKRSTGDSMSGDNKSLLILAYNNTLRLLSLVNDFLDLDKLESGNLKMDRQVCSLSDIVAQAVQNNQSYADQFGVTFRLNDTTIDVKVYCDAGRIEQVVTNFLSNAAKYGGENDIIEIFISKPGINIVRVSVIDHGKGVPEDIKDRIFKKFVMSNVDKNDKVRNSGMGLYIARVIVEVHGGEVGFSSSSCAGTGSGIGSGTTFYFELPVVKEKTS